jgi:anaerobic selenocysteine-containing dehydrogenase
MSGNILSRGLTRRQFVKTAAAAAAAVAVGDKLLGGRKSALVANAAGANAPKQDSWHTGVCFLCTQSDCITQVHVVDGVVIKVEGNPKACTNAGTLCPRGNSAIMTLYNPWRVKAPIPRSLSPLIPNGWRSPGTRH